MIRKILFDRFGKLRNGWWFLLFFSLMAAILGATLFASLKFQFEVTMPMQVVIVLSATWICQILRNRPIGEITGKFNLQWLKEFAIGNAAGAALMLVPAMALAGIGLVSWSWNPDARSGLLSGLSICISVALAEELLFRGFIFQRFIDGLGQWPAQLILAGWFLLTHLNNPGMTGSVKLLAGLNIFLASIMFGLAFLRTKSLAMPIGLHFMANWMQGGVLGFGVSGNASSGLLIPLFNGGPDWLTGGQFGLEASVPGLVCVIATMAILYRWKSARLPSGLQPLRKLP